MTTDNPYYIAARWGSINSYTRPFTFNR